MAKETATKAKATKAAKAVKTPVVKSHRKPRYSVVFHRPTTLKKDRRYAKFYFACRTNILRTVEIKYGKGKGEEQSERPLPLPFASGVCQCGAKLQRQQITLTLVILNIFQLAEAVAERSCAFAASSH